MESDTVSLFENLTEDDVLCLEVLAASLAAKKEVEDSWSSSGALGDKVSGIQVIRNGVVIQEWKQ